MHSQTITKKNKETRLDDPNFAFKRWTKCKATSSVVYSSATQLQWQNHRQPRKAGWNEPWECLAEVSALHGLNIGLYIYTYTSTYALTVCFPRICVSSQMLWRGLAWSVCLPHVIPVFHPFSIPQAWTGPGARLGAGRRPTARRHDGTTRLDRSRPLPRITTTGPT